jgi:predicted aspartyl protease
MSFPYDTSYHPAMPILEVILCVPESSLSSDRVLAIVDTGSDITAIPKEYLVQLGAPVVGGGYLSSPWGDRQRIKIYEVDLRVGDYKLYSVEAAAAPSGNEILLGRNALNQLNLQLDGPNQTVTLGGALR